MKRGYEKRKKFISLCIEDASSHYKMFCALFVRSYLITVHLRKMQILQSLSLSVLYILVHAHICTYMITTIIITTIILFIFFYRNRLYEILFPYLNKLLYDGFTSYRCSRILLASHKSDRTELNISLL